MRERGSAGKGRAWGHRLRPRNGTDPALLRGLVAGGWDERFLPSAWWVELLLTNSEFHICVALETYSRRPPVETKGWEHVVELGYDSPTGRMEFTDGSRGTEMAYPGQGDKVVTYRRPAKRR